METLEVKINRFLTKKLSYGYGFGYGDGFGYGSGYGFGYGDGFGYGSGFGYGDGFGYGLNVINNQKIYMVDNTETIITSVKGNIAKGFILKKDLNLKPCYIVKYGDYFAHGETIKQAVADAQSKALQDLSVEERIDMFKQEFTDQNKKYSASKFFEWHNILTGSCEYGRKSFIESNGIDIEKDSFTIQEFINLTKNSYGSEIIKQL